MRYQYSSILYLLLAALDVIVVTSIENATISDQTQLSADANKTTTALATESANSGNDQNNVTADNPMKTTLFPNSNSTEETLSPIRPSNDSIATTEILVNETSTESSMTSAYDQSKTVSFTNHTEPFGNSDQTTSKIGTNETNDIQIGNTTNTTLLMTTVGYSSPNSSTFNNSSPDDQSIILTSQDAWPTNSTQTENSDNQTTPAGLIVAALNTTVSNDETKNTSSPVGGTSPSSGSDQTTSSSLKTTNAYGGSSISVGTGSYHDSNQHNPTPTASGLTATEGDDRDKKTAAIVVIVLFALVLTGFIVYITVVRWKDHQKKHNYRHLKDPVDHP